MDNTHYYIQIVFRKFFIGFGVGVSTDFQKELYFELPFFAVSFALPHSDNQPKKLFRFVK